MAVNQTNAIYRYFVTHDSVTTEVFPYGFDEANIEAEREKQSTFDSPYLRRFYTGNLIFKNYPLLNQYDFNLISNIEDSVNNCLPIYLEISRSCDVGVTWQNDWWLGKFTTADGKFDYDNCTFEVEPKPNDIYSCIEEGAENEFNMISLPDEYTVENPGNPPTFEYFADYTVTCSPSTSPSGSGWTSFWNDCDGMGTSTIYLWFREYKWTNCVAGNPIPPTGAGWTLDTNNCAIDGTAKYVRTPTISLPSPWPAEDVVLSSCSGGVPVNPNDFGGYHTSPYWTLVWDGCDPVTGNGYSYWWDYVPPAAIETYTHTRKVLDLVDGVANSACADITGVISDFFNWNPVGDAPGYVAGENYVTQDVNKLTNFFISAKSDVLNPTASQPATVANITFASLMKYLVDEFNVRWYITSSLRLRIEHVSYFQETQVEDFTVAPYAKQMSGHYIVTRIKDQRPKYEKYKWMEADGIDFVGTDIYYPQECVSLRTGRGTGILVTSENSELHSVDRITTDIEYIVASPSDIGKDGFVMFVCDNNSGTYTIASETGKISGNVYLNAHLSWANLHYNYHRHARVLLEGNMNGITETFFTARPTKQIDNALVSDCCDGIDDTVLTTGYYTGTILTNIGQGKIQSYRKELQKNKITIKLRF